MIVILSKLLRNLSHKSYAYFEKAFDKVEEEWLAVAKPAFEAGFAKTAYVGSCALVTLVIDNKLYVANAGDCKGVLLRKDPENPGKYKTVNISKTFSANKKYEQERLRKAWPKENDIFVCKRGDSKACYVKGGLMPSRAFGDLRLKHREFNFHQFSSEQGYRRPIPVFNGPYISYKPDIQVFDLTKDDAYIILASDGLWDEVKRKEAGKIIEGNENNESIPHLYLEAAVKNVQKEKGISEDFLLRL